MAIRVFSNPAVIVNDENVRIVPNTLAFQLGYGETNVRAASIGSGRGESVHSVDVESGISMVKFDMHVTADLSDKIREWKENIGENTIKFVQRVGTENVNRTFTGMSLVTDPEQAASADGVASFEFKGDPAV